MAEQRTGPTPQTTSDDDATVDEHGHPIGSDIERIEHGFAPLMNPIVEAASARRGDRHAIEAEVNAQVEAEAKAAPKAESKSPART